MEPVAVRAGAGRAAVVGATEDADVDRDPRHGKEERVDRTRNIAVAAEDEAGLDGRVAGHFGRCRAYVVVEIVGDEIRGSRVVVNPHVETHQPG
jgi:hypothetical protein